MVKCRTLNYFKFTFDLFPEFVGQVKSVGIVSDGELSSRSCGSSKETDFALSVRRNAVTEAGQWNVSKDLKLFKGHAWFFKLLFELLFYNL